jgi:hypothetical protein
MGESTLSIRGSAQYTYLNVRGDIRDHLGDVAVDPESLRIPRHWVGVGIRSGFQTVDLSE